MNDSGNGAGSPGNKPAGVKEIANALGVSIGTVDRAIHGRPGINETTRARVLRMAEKLGYRPNFAARHLRLNRKLKVAIHLPEEIASFFDALRDGIQEAADLFQSTIELDFRSHRRLGEHEVELFRSTLARDPAGIIIAPGQPNRLKPWIRRATRKNIPVVCVATDAPGTERLTAISSDPYISGAMVAELLTRFNRQSGRVLVVTGDLSTNDHSEKVRGFSDSLAELGSSLKPAKVVEAHDDREQAYDGTQAAIARFPDLRAVYVSTANSLPVVQAIEDAKGLGRIQVITTDLFPALVPLIRSGNVLGTVYQRPRAQGRMAIQCLYRFLVEKVTPPVRYRLAPHIVLRSNLELFQEEFHRDLEQAPAGFSADALNWKL